VTGAGPKGSPGVSVAGDLPGSRQKRPPPRPPTSAARVSCCRTGLSRDATVLRGCCRRIARRVGYGFRPDIGVGSRSRKHDAGGAHRQRRQKHAQKQCATRHRLARRLSGDDVRRIHVLKKSKHGSFERNFNLRGGEAGALHGAQRGHRSPPRVGSRVASACRGPRTEEESTGVGTRPPRCGPTRKLHGIVRLPGRCDPAFSACRGDSLRSPIGAGGFRGFAVIDSVDR
jgi:hypothetical protein